MDTQLEMKRETRSVPKIGRRHIMIACAVLLIAAAVVLNVVLFTNQTPTVDTPNTDVGTNTGDGTTDDGSTAVDGYFSATQVSRQRARDEALEVLQSVVDSAEADEATKTGALMEIAALAEDTAEGITAAKIELTDEDVPF